MKLRLVSTVDAARRVFDRYTAAENFFPIIGAVLEGRQQGSILVQPVDNPSSFLVLHKFGFCQIVNISADAQIDPVILDLLTGYSSLTGLPEKFRVYAVSDRWNEAIQQNPRLTVEETKRIRFATVAQYPETGECEYVTESNIEEVSNALGMDIGSRFWDSYQDAALQGLGVFARDEHGTPACVCYAAAVCNGKAEIDVITHPDHRMKGWAGMVTSCFIANCKKKGIHPVWDCFANNAASINTAQKCHFERSFVYRFLTIKPSTG